MCGPPVMGRQASVAWPAGGLGVMGRNKPTRLAMCA